MQKENQSCVRPSILHGMRTADQGGKVHADSQTSHRGVKKMMQFAGVIDSEETMGGLLSDGRRIYAHMLSVYLSAPEGQRDDPEYWRQRLEAGDFEDDENYPEVWVEEGGDDA